MPKQVRIVIKNGGKLTFVYDDELACLLSLGDYKTQRASHVEPVLGSWWQVDMTPFGGPVFPYLFLYRKDALAAEHRYLESEIFHEPFVDPTNVIIYALLDEKGYVGYVGKTKRLMERYREHKDSKPWASAVAVLEYVTEVDWQERERYWIATYRNCPFYQLVNKTEGGAGGPNTASELSRQRMSLAHTGKVIPTETREKMSKAQSGKTLSEEHKRKISTAGRKRFSSQEARAEHGRSVNTAFALVSAAERRKRASA